MQVPLQFTLKNIKHSEAIEERVREKASKLDQFSDRIISCHVCVEKLSDEPEHYNARILITMPNKKELVSTHNETNNLWLSLTTAFDDMTRQVEETNRIISGHTKSHAEILEGEISRLFENEQYGFITGIDGEEYYFNSGSLHHPQFSHLKPGQRVKFLPAWDSEGPRAHRVSAKTR